MTAAQYFACAAIATGLLLLAIASQRWGTWDD